MSRFLTVADIEHQLEIASHWIPLVQAAAMYDPKQDAFNLLMLAQVIMKDEVVAARHSAKAQSWRPTEEQKLPPSFWALVLNEMSGDERAALHARIIKRLATATKRRKSKR
jgi:hypothetical protein